MKRWCTFRSLQWTGTLVIESQKLVHCTCLCIASGQPNRQMVIFFDCLKNKVMWGFKRYIFIRCRTEYEVKDQAAKGDEVTRKRFHAFVLFLGELYLNLEVRRKFSFVIYWQSLRHKLISIKILCYIILLQH